MLPIFIDSTAYNSGQRLDNVNKTNLVLANGKLVIQKSIRGWSNQKKSFHTMKFNNHLGDQIMQLLASDWL